MRGWGDTVDRPVRNSVCDRLRYEKMDIEKKLQPLYRRSAEIFRVVSAFWLADETRRVRATAASAKRELPKDLEPFARAVAYLKTEAEAHRALAQAIGLYDCSSQAWRSDPGGFGTRASRRCSR
jgi:hypothetical protein